MHYFQFTSDNAEPRLIGTRIIGIVLYIYTKVVSVCLRFSSVDAIEVVVKSRCLEKLIVAQFIKKFSNSC
jgi:hypothetical protein